MSPRPVFIVAGVGNGTGTGGSSARLFAKQGYKVALIARNADHLHELEKEINGAGGEAASFPIQDYSYKAVLGVFDAVKAHKWSEPTEIRAALWNASAAPFKGFLEVTEDDLKLSLENTVVAPFAFSRQAILAFKENELDDKGKRGTLLFTGATASLRGNVHTSAIAPAKFGLRALSQSLSKEFGKENIHVAHNIIDGVILTDLTASRRSAEAREQFTNDEDVRLNPDSIAQSYLYLVNQDRSAWTWELDLRPAHEKW